MEIFKFFSSNTDGHLVLGIIWVKGKPVTVKTDDDIRDLENLIMCIRSGTGVDLTIPAKIKMGVMVDWK